jgi:hypothetical protein
MIETAVALLLAHLLGDFLLQTDALARAKRSLGGLALHGTHVAVLIALAIGVHGRGLPLALIVLTHLLVDAVKARVVDPRAPAPRRQRRLIHPFTAFTVDQLLHLVMLATVVGIWPEAARSGAIGWVVGTDGSMPVIVVQALIVATALVALVPMGSIMIAIALQDFGARLQSADASGDATDGRESPGSYGPPADMGLPGAGKVIGWLERLLVFSFAVAGSFTAVGFVVTAKSVLRLGEINKGDRATAEYIIIGTMLSFAWALLVALCTSGAMDLLPPARPPFTTSGGP